MKNKLFKTLVSNCIAIAMAIGMIAASAQAAPAKVASSDRRDQAMTVPIPEPTSLAVVLLAGVMVTRRRRRPFISTNPNFE